MKRYYSRLRPVGPGTYPRNGARDIHNYDDRQYIPDAGCDVLGYIDYDRELAPEEARSYDLVAGGKTDDAKTLSDLSGIEAKLFYSLDDRPELRDAHAYLKAAIEEFHRATGVTLCSTGEPEPTLTLSFTVKRRSISATQQYADVYCNGEKIVSGFGDDKEIIKPGEAYFGYLSGNCWGSSTPDTQFIKGAIFPLYDPNQRLTGKLREIIDREIEKERATAKTRGEGR